MRNKEGFSLPPQDQHLHTQAVQSMKFSPWQLVSRVCNPSAFLRGIEAKGYCCSPSPSERCCLVSLQRHPSGSEVATRMIRGNSLRLPGLVCNGLGGKWESCD